MVGREYLKEVFLNIFRVSVIGKNVRNSPFFEIFGIIKGLKIKVFLS